MEILQFLLSYFLNNSNLDALNPIIETLKQNDFDVKKVISSLNPQTIIPILNSFMQSLGQNKNPSPSFCEEEGLVPLNDFADIQIIDCLNSYFSRDL